MKKRWNYIGTKYMKTKKEILEWWERRGRIMEHINDYNDFYLNCQIPQSKVSTSNGGSKITIKKRCWKYPLVLFFDKSNECFRITGF